MFYRPAPKTARYTPYHPTEGTCRIRLDANESFLMPTVNDRERMLHAAADIALNRYPDPIAEEVCRNFAELYGIQRELVTAGNGSDELISLILSAFLQKGEKVLTLNPDFSMYRFYTAITENPCLVLDKGEDLRVDPQKVLQTIEQEGIRLFIFSNPCNPTSLGLEKEGIRFLLKRTDTLIVVDEAYMDFWDQSLLPEVEKYNNLMILRTASKALGLAALRLGFAVANPELTKILQAAKSPYNVNSVTQAMAAVVLRNRQYHTSYFDLLIESRDMLVNGLKELESQNLLDKVYDSCTNFAYVETQYAEQLFEQLKERGILVRLLDSNHLRITAGTQAENRELLDTVEFLMKMAMHQTRGRDR